MISTSDFKRNLRIQIDGEPYVILDVHVQSPSARGASSLSKIKVRNLKTGQVFDKTFRGGDKVEEPNVELRPVQFLYRDDDGAGSGGYLKEGFGGIRSVLFNGAVMSVELPNTVVLQVVDTAPAVKG